MSKLREAAQAALEHWDKVSGIFRMTTETNRLRAALAAPENRPCTCHPDDNPPQPCAQRYALTECKALAQPEAAQPGAWAVMCDGDIVKTCLTETAANLIADNLREQNRGRDFDWQTTPLYAHPPRNEWLPASGIPTEAAAHALGQTGSPAIDGERLAFEAWVRGHGWALGAMWDGTSYRGTAEHGAYVCPVAMNTRRMWAAWRDRAALSRSRDVQPPTEGKP